MKMTVIQDQMPDSITILHLEGTLDSSNSENLVKEAQKLFSAGIYNLLLDLSNLTFISSAGLRAFHQVARLFQNRKQPGGGESWADYRWAAYRGKPHDMDRTAVQHVKLLSPSKEVRKVLDMIGFSSIFEIYTDLDQATASFYPVTA